MNKRTDEEWQGLLTKSETCRIDIEARWRDEQRTSENLRGTLKDMQMQMKDLEATLADKRLLVHLLKEKCGVK
jgi:hypothetical protein